MKIYKDSIFAGIVLYNPDINRLKKNIHSLMQQIKNLVLIDNGSNNFEEVAKLYSDFENIYIISFKTNKGIAAALNKMIIWGKDNGFKWCLTMDQDSVADLSMISNIVDSANQTLLDNVGMVVPTIIDINMNFEHKDTNEIVEIDKSESVITSGSLMNIESVESVGMYNEKYFIDYVDTELQERLLRSNFKIIRVVNAYLYHEVGHITTHRFLLWKIVCSNHSAFRRYYQVRNRLAFKKKYFGNLSFIKEYIRLHLGDIKILLFEEDKKKKIFASIRGYRDYKLLL